MSKSTAVAKASDAAVPVDPEQTLKACKALVAHIKKSAAAPRDDGKQNLLADAESTVAETPVWLTLTTKKHIHDSHRMSNHQPYSAASCACITTSRAPTGPRPRRILCYTRTIANRPQASNQAKSSSPTPSTPAKSSASA
jgi:hypothetical protein